MEEVNKISSGLYEVQWKSGGASKAAVGVTSNGNRWLAPTNWVSFAYDYRKTWRLVESVRSLENG